MSAVRVVEFQLTLSDGNIYPVDFAYIISPREQLIAGYNSFQTLREGHLSAMSVANTTNWDASTEPQRVAAMMEAYRRICSLRFTDITQGQAYLNESRILGDLSRVPPREFKDLSYRLRRALHLAQIAEAEAVLGGGEQADLLRKAGLISQTIGETQEMWRSSKPLDMRVSKAAMMYLAPYVSLNMRSGRS
ncbi:hypothetical protein [Acinetobacter brisouii]|uniref:hypothetical protein n=1 Tax=Acinetobacter brisouii TaxID=396323 RepID=UPI00124D707D|nr:hypothetical protein [Acinetobacter brisouii]